MVKFQKKKSLQVYNIIMFCQQSWLLPITEKLIPLIQRNAVPLDFVHETFKAFCYSWISILISYLMIIYKKKKQYATFCISLLKPFWVYIQISSWKSPWKTWDTFQRVCQRYSTWTSINWQKPFHTHWNIIEG